MLFNYYCLNMFSNKLGNLYNIIQSYMFLLLQMQRPWKLHRPVTTIQQPHKTCTPRPNTHQPHPHMMLLLKRTNEKNWLNCQENTDIRVTHCTQESQFDLIHSQTFSGLWIKGHIHLAYNLALFKHQNVIS